MAAPKQPQKPAKPRKPLAAGYKPPASTVAGLDPASRSFLTGGAAETPTPKTPPAQSYSLDSEGSDGSFTAVVPKFVIRWVMLATAARRVTKARPYTQKAIAAAALEEWLNKHHPELRPNENEPND